MMDSASTYGSLLRRVRRLGLGAGVAGLLAAAGGLIVDAEAFFQGWLAAWVFWMGVPLGSLALLMLHHVAGGAWGLATRRLLEAGALTIGLMAVFFLPVLFGMRELYEWTHADVVAEDPKLQHKRPYLNTPFFVIRNLIYFAFWIGTAYFLRKWSARLDETGNPKRVARLRQISAVGLIGHVLLLTFATTDWVMSLEPHWFSSIFSWMMLTSETLTALAITILVLRALREYEPLAGLVRTKHFHDYGNLTLAFVILWTYMMFAQYVIIWAGNLPEDIGWYVHRRKPGWGWIPYVLLIFHFALPFFLLLSRRVKRSARALSMLAAGILSVHVIFVAWLVLPSFEHAPVASLLIAASSFVGIGGALAAAYAYFLAQRPLLIRKDPRFEEQLEQASANEKDAAAHPDAS